VHWELSAFLPFEETGRSLHSVPTSFDWGRDFDWVAACSFLDS
jgi:hypothetical protein